MKTGKKPHGLLLASGLILAVLVSAASTAGASGTLVLPFRTVGVSDTTAAVSLDILVQELRSRGVAVLNTRSLESELPALRDACDEPACASKLGGDYGADQVVYGSLSRLGDKIILRAECLRIGNAVPHYTDRLSALTEEDVDKVLLRVAEGVAAGRTNSDQATVDSVTLDETQDPNRRAGKKGLGLRGGLLFPVGNSYGDERLTDLRLVYKFEGRDFMIETTTLMGLAWGSGSVEWNLLDVFAARVFGIGDTSAFVGGGLGFRVLHVEKDVDPLVDPLEPPYYYPSHREQNVTTLSADVGAGLIALRTYEYNLVLEARYHYVFDDFDDLGGNGAHGVIVSFGMSQ